MFTDTAWASAITSAFDEAIASELIGLQVEVDLHNAGAYYRRVVSTCERFPALFVLFAKSPAHSCCDDRKRVARLCLDTPEEKLDITSLKIKLLFVVEITDAATTGECDNKLFSLGHAISTSYSHFH